MSHTPGTLIKVPQGELRPIRQDDYGTPEEEHEIPTRRQEERETTRRRTHEEEEEDKGILSAAADIREGERHVQKLATFQEERGPNWYVNLTGEGDVISSGEGNEDDGSGKSCFGTTETCT
ncbi:hypothetical protein NDU88_005812 [Pleurodeles waltl]|uniref:Uncharacterized protein n=1 Tax=Pleurodeles waltl TaxID=8319 RepID=A0AAV7UK12_PLEWA|nr:hypothetical protein NDU88_005812 [Pleurodeles waltl]